MDPLPAVIWSTEARRELPARANGRHLVLDYFATRCCGRNVSVGDLHLRWIAAREPIAEEFLPLRAPAGLDAHLQRDLVGVLDTTQGRIAMGGWGPFRRPIVELEDGAVWLDFIGACRTRSPLRHRSNMESRQQRQTHYRENVEIGFDILSDLYYTYWETTSIWSCSRTCGAALAVTSRFRARLTPVS